MPRWRNRSIADDVAGRGAAGTRYSSLAVAMSDSVPIDKSDGLIDLLRAAEAELSGEPNAVTFRSADLGATLDRVEAATPGGAPLHAQLDTVRKWFGALEQSADHKRFGGTAHLRAHVATQLRLAIGALEDYWRARRT
jgi:hypothetical protein